MRMRIIHRLVLLFAGLSLLKPAPAGELTGTAEQRLLKDIKYLSSDALEGRGIGTEGLNKAAEYVRSGFLDAGLNIDVVDGDSYQKFQMVTGVELGSDKSLTFSGPESQTIDLKLGQDFNRRSPVFD